MSEDVQQVIDEIRRVLGSRAREWVAVPTNGEDDSWGIRERGEDVGLSVAQMVWKWDAQFIVAAPRLLQQAADLLAQQAKDLGEARALLNPQCNSETLCGAIRNLQQAHLSEKGNAEAAEARADALAARVKELEEKLARVEDSQYHPPSARPSATAATDEAWAALERIADWSDCACEHDDDNCCANVPDPEYHCPGCIAAQALAMREKRQPADAVARGSGDSTE